MLLRSTWTLFTLTNRLRETVVLACAELNYNRFVKTEPCIENPVQFLQNDLWRPMVQGTSR